MPKDDKVTVTEESPSGPAKPADDADDTSELLTNQTEDPAAIDAELKQIDADFKSGKSEGEPTDSKEGEPAGDKTEKPKPDTEKPAEQDQTAATDAAVQQELEELTDEDRQALGRLSPKVLSKYPQLKRYVDQGADLLQVLALHDQNVQNYHHLASLAGRVGMSVPQLIESLERGVTAGSSGQPLPQPPVPEKPAIDDKQLEEFGVEIGMNPDQIKRFAQLVTGLTPQNGDQVTSERLQRLEAQMGNLHQTSSQSTWETLWTQAVVDNQAGENVKRIGRDELARIIQQEEYYSDGFSSRLLRDGVNPFVYAANRMKAINPTAFLQKVGAVKQGQPGAPTVLKPTGSATLDEASDKPLEEQNLKELASTIRGLGGTDFEDDSEMEGGF